jgi:ribosomal protein S18 acetylase RimI-like enzyme
MIKSRAQQRLINSWADIVLTVVSIIQGFAFSDLAIRSPEIYRHLLSTGDWTILAHFVLCFALLFRILQTYVTAALDYHEWSVSLFDLFVIFMIGTFEYFLFSCLDTKSFDFVEFHSRLAVISVFGLVGFAGALFRLHEDLFASYLEFEKERRLQFVNLAGIAIVLALSISVIAFGNLLSPFQVGVAFVDAFILTLNVFYSIRTTFSFGVRAYHKSSVLFQQPDSPDRSTHLAAAHIQIEGATRSDVTGIVDLLLEHFGYVFFFVFDTSYRLSRSMLRRLLLMRSGKHTFGYRSFVVAHDRNSNDVVGLLLLTRRTRNNWLGFFALGVHASFITITTTGLLGLARAIKNLPIAITARPAVYPAEENISYLAVSQDHQRQGIGAQMVGYAATSAQSSGMEKLTVQVRESKQEVRRFFHGLGFKEDAIIESDSDATFGLGRQVRLVLSLGDMPPV